MKKIILFLMIIVSIITVTGCGNSKYDKMLSYLENNHFDCENGIEDQDYDGKTCIKGNNENMEKFEIWDAGIIYTVKNGPYEYALSDLMYLDKDKKTYLIMESDDLTCLYLLDNGTFVYSYGYGGNFGINSTDPTCKEYNDKINESLRKFEKYCEDANFKLEK